MVGKARKSTHPKGKLGGRKVRVNFDFEYFCSILHCFLWFLKALFQNKSKSSGGSDANISGSRGQTHTKNDLVQVGRIFH